MTYFLFCLLCVLSAFFLMRGLRRKDGVFQFSVIFPAAFAFATVPQLVPHVFYPGKLPDRVYADGGVEYGIIMCILCLLAGVVGYGRQFPHARTTPNLVEWVSLVTHEKIFWVGLVMGAIGIYGMLRLDALAGGFTARLTGGGHYALEWSGSSVLFAYVGKLIPLALALCLNSALATRSLFKLFFCLLLLVYPLSSIIFLGRRTPVMTLALIIAVSLWFQRRWAPPRLISLLAFATGGLLIILLPAYRFNMTQTGDVRSSLQQVEVKERLQQYWEGDKREGMDNLIVGVVARMKERSFGYGTGFWNTTVDYMVPAQIVGRSFKDSLFFKVTDPDDSLFLRTYGYEREFDSFGTGPYSVFAEFSYLGCLLFFFVARLYKRIWQLANERRLLSAQVFYTATVLFVPMSVVNSLPDAFSMFVFVTSVLLGVLLLSREKNQPARGRRGRFRRRREATAREPVST